MKRYYNIFPDKKAPNIEIEKSFSGLAQNFSKFKRKAIEFDSNQVASFDWEWSPPKMVVKRSSKKFGIVQCHSLLPGLIVNKDVESILRIDFHNELLFFDIIVNGSIGKYFSIWPIAVTDCLCKDLSQTSFYNDEVTVFKYCINEKCVNSSINFIRFPKPFKLVNGNFLVSDTVVTCLKSLEIIFDVYDDSVSS